MQLKFYEADTIKSSSIMIYWDTKQDIYTQRHGMMLMLIGKGDVTSTKVKWGGGKVADSF